MIRIGLTGGIGMGKSTAATLLAERGIPVIDTDTLAREIVAPGQPALSEIGDAFGPSVLFPDGTLRRETLASMVFADDSRRRRLEGILHPRIRAGWLAFLGRCQTEGRAAAAVVVIPLLFETGAEQEFDRVVCIACTTATQMQRLSARGWTAEQSRQRLASQWPAQKKIDHAHSMIWTEVSREVHGEQWDRVLRQLGVT